MTTIFSQVTDLVLVAQTYPTVTSGNKNTVRLHVKFDAEWDGYAKSALFFKEGDVTPLERVLSSDGYCTLPPEILGKAGYIYIGVKGEKGADTKNSGRIRYKIVPGAPAIIVSDPEPTVYQQIITAYSETNGELEKEKIARAAADASESAKIAKEVDVERKRIDNLLAGSTADDAELIDVRVDADGETHNSAGTAIRNQITDLRRHHIKPNLIDLNKLSAGYLTDSDNVTATAMSEDCYYSDYIPVDNTLPYYLSVNNKLNYTSQWLAVSTYDSELNFIKRQSWYVGEKKLDFDENVACVRVSFRGLFLHDVKFEQSTYPTANEHDTSPNLHDVYPLTLPGYVDTPGSIHVPTQEGYVAEGVVANERYSRFIPVSAGEVYVFYNGVKEYPWCGVGFYDAEGKFIVRETVKTGESGFTEITVPDGAVAMRFSARTHTQHSFVLYKKTGKNDYMDAYVKALIASNTPSVPMYHAVKAVAHRGYSSEAPENTLPAYRLAKKKGFEYVECDVSFTADNVAVLLHDATIDRTSNSTGNISDLTFETVRSIDFGSWTNEASAGTVIPTFEEFILLCRNIGLRPYVELKAGTEAQIKSLVGIVARHGMLKETTWISFNADYLRYIRDCDGKARLGFTVEAVTANVIAAVMELQNYENEVFIDSHSYTDAEVNLCLEAATSLEVWTVNSAKTIQNMSPYVSGVTSDSQHAGSVLYEYGMS